MKEKEKTAILFVCMGNICRSPLAEGVARVARDEAGLALRLDSAGTHDYHIGHPPDRRARAIAQEIGCGIDDLRARQVGQEDFRCFDLILAADAGNLAWLRQQCPDDARAELALLLPWCGAPPGSEVPDPYHGDIEGFRIVARQLREAMPGLLGRVRGRA